MISHFVKVHSWEWSFSNRPYLIHQHSVAPHITFGVEFPEEESLGKNTLLVYKL